jgi:hypothetical protein
MSFNDIYIGDTVEIKNNSDNIVIKKGNYKMKVTAEDKHSFAVESHSKWWFYRDSGQAYVGDAVVIRKIQEGLCDFRRT